jgi:hypothetical protein
VVMIENNDVISFNERMKQMLNIEINEEVLIKKKVRKRGTLNTVL